MKRTRLFWWLLVVTAAMALFAVSASAEIVDSGTCGKNGDNVTWSLTSDGTLTISGTGEMEDCYSDQPWSSYRSDITSVIIEPGISRIGGDAFRFCDNLTTVMIPESVINIGYYAFSECNALSSIQVEAENPNYASDDIGCLYNKEKTTLIQYPIGRAETSFSIPDGVTRIGLFAFRECESLSTVSIPESVTAIEFSAFEYCTSLTDITIPDSVTEMGDNVFSSCVALTSITIPKNVTEIGVAAFEDCENLASVTMPTSVKSIGDSAFESCTSLTDVYYEGTEEQWKQIFIDEDNDPLTSADIHFNAVIETPGESADPSTEPTATASAGTEKETSSSVRNTLLRVLPVLFVLLFSVGLALTVVGQMQINRLKKTK